VFGYCIVVSLTALVLFVIKHFTKYTLCFHTHTHTHLTTLSQLLAVGGVTISLYPHRTLWRYTNAVLLLLLLLSPLKLFQGVHLGPIRYDSWSLHVGGIGVILLVFVFTWYRVVTDEQADRQTDRQLKTQVNTSLDRGKIRCMVDQ